MASNVRAVLAAVILTAVAASTIFLLTTVGGESPAEADAALASDQTEDSGTPSPAPTVEEANAPVSPTPTPTPTEPPEPEALWASGDSGDDVRELQSRLKQIAWYTPDINGEYDAVTEQAVAGFQEKRGYDATGAVDQQTWDKLVEMTREPTEDEKHNRLTPGPTIIGPGGDEREIRELQARLAQIGWFNQDVTGEYRDATKSSVAGFQRKRGIPETGEVDQRTWDRLVEMTREPTEDELYNREPEPPAVDDSSGLDERCLTGRVLCIDKSASSLRWVVDGEVRYTAAARFGCPGMETDEGEFEVFYKSRNHTSSIYETWMPFAMFFNGDEAVHYSPDFAATGYDGCSHGCVNIRDKEGITWLFDNEVRVGDKVVVYWS